MKIGACFSVEAIDCTEISRNMSQAQRLNESQSSMTFPVTHGAISYLVTSDELSDIALVRKGQNGNFLLVIGVPIDLQGSLETRLQGLVDRDISEAVKSLSSFDGAFAAVFWDARNKQVAIITDPLGMQPLYLARERKTLLLGTELKAFPASGMIDVQMDPASWGAFISLGYTVGDHTQLAGVKRVSPGCILSYDPATDDLKSSSYWNWPGESSGMTLEDVDTGQLVEVMQQEFAAYGQHRKSGTVLLSGGFDSRLLLASLCHGGFHPEALILAHQDELWGTDGRIANRVAKRLGVDHKVVKPPKSFFCSSSYLDYLAMNEVTTPSFCSFIAQVSAYVNRDMGAVWDGVAPGICLHPYPLPQGGMKAYLKQESRNRETYGWHVARQMFGQDKAEEMYEAFRHSLKEEAAKYSNDEIGIYEFKARNYMRNRLVLNAMKVYANTVLPFTPGFSKAFWTLASVIPHALKTSGKTYFRIFNNHFRQVADFPFLSGTTLFYDKSPRLANWLTLSLYGLSGNATVKTARKLYHKLLRGSRRYWLEFEILDLIRANMDLGHRDIDADGVRKLRRDTRLPFYWQMWRWVMEGRLNLWNSKIFLEQCQRMSR